MIKRLVNWIVNHLTSKPVLKLLSLFISSDIIKGASRVGLDDFRVLEIIYNPVLPFDKFIVQSSQFLSEIHDRHYLLDGILHSQYSVLKKPINFVSLGGGVTDYSGYYMDDITIIDNNPNFNKHILSLSTRRIIADIKTIDFTDYLEDVNLVEATGLFEYFTTDEIEDTLKRLRPVLDKKGFTIVISLLTDKAPKSFLRRMLGDVLHFRNETFWKVMLIMTLGKLQFATCRTYNGSVEYIVARKGE